jgi:hypothetical protein
VFAGVLVVSSAIDIQRNGWADIQDQVPVLFLALLTALAFCGAVTFAAKQLLATIGPTEVHVQESGVGVWKEPLEAYRGVAWLYFKSESFSRLFQTSKKAKDVNVEDPDVTLYHWIELLHPDRKKSLVLAIGPAEEGMRERLKQLSQALDRPMVAMRTEDDGMDSVAAIPEP